MNPSILFLFSLLSLTTILPGCASITPQQEAMIDSGIRVTTMAYILKADTPTAQAARAAQVKDATARVRTHISLEGDVVPDIEQLSQWVNKAIDARADLSVNDKKLAKAVFLEVTFIAQDNSVAAVNIGVENAQKVYQLLGQVDRVAEAFL